MKCQSLIAILAALTLHACGLRTHGGIVDNGNKPADPISRPQPDPGHKDTEEKVTPVPVLTQFQVSVPEKWPVDAMLESNIVSFNGNDILFAEASGICPVEPAINQFDVKIYACSATVTIFDVGYGDFIIAKHGERNADIDLVLYSFRRN